MANKYKRNKNTVWFAINPDSVCGPFSSRAVAKAYIIESSEQWYTQGWTIREREVVDDHRGTWPITLGPTFSPATVARLERERAMREKMKNIRFVAESA